MQLELSIVVGQLSRYAPVELVETRYSSAVGLILIESNQGLQIILVKRIANSRTYASDWCLPGGRAESTDNSLSETAVREICEEIGLKATQLTLIGQLDDFYTAKAERVRPFVFYSASRSGNITLSQTELVGYQLLDLERILDIEVDHLNLKGSTRLPPYALHLPIKNMMEVGDPMDQVWGLTASILVSFRNICYDRSDPIDKTLSFKLGHILNLVS